MSTPLIESLLEPWIPPTCAACRAHGLIICDACRRSLVRVGAIRAPEPCSYAWAAFAYDESARRIIHTFKFSRRHSLASWLGACIVATRPEQILIPDLVTWVPASRRKRAGRGFDQAELLAANVASRLGVPCCGLLERRDWGSQTRRSRAERRVGPTFRVRCVAPASARVLIVDDVMTTGASLSAAATALRRSSFGEITAATVARSGQDARAHPTQQVDSGNGRPSKHQTS